MYVQITPTKPHRGALGGGDADVGVEGHLLGDEGAAEDQGAADDADHGPGAVFLVGEVGNC